MAGFSTLYEEVPTWMHLSDDVELPMWVLLLDIAEPAGMRQYGAADLDRARAALGWARFLWNTFRLPTAPRLRTFAMHQAALDAFCPVRSQLTMVMRAQSWQADRRIVTHAAIEVGPTGEWRLAVATA